MVNIGRPSRGCTTCIRRKIGCDRQWPGCGQCQKSNRRCGGYRSEADLMFRDQSESMSARFRAISQGQAKEKEAPAPISPNRFDTDVAEHAPSSGPGSAAMIRTPRLNAESGLITFYTNNFACSSSNRGNNLFWMPNNFDDLMKDDSARYSVQSVGAMALARLQKSNHYFREAQKYYGLALLSLAEMWQQHLEIEKDAILIAITCLGFFEILLSHDSPSSRRSWATHLGGLGVLLRKRDNKFFSTEFGSRMHLQSRSQVILNALQTKTPVPEAYRQFQQVERSLPPQHIPPVVADILLTRLATLQAECQTSAPTNALITELRMLDADFLKWTASVPLPWSFSPQPSENAPQFWWDVRRDVYPVAVIAHVWNKIRTGRIIVRDLIQELSVRLSPLDEDILRLAIGGTNSSTMDSELRGLVTDICATIPTYYRPSRASTRDDSGGSKPPLGSAFWYLWELEVVGSMREAPLDLRRWAVSCLERIYETTGIVKARVGADRVKLRLQRVLEGLKAQEPVYSG